MTLSQELTNLKSYLNSNKKSVIKTSSSDTNDGYAATATRLTAEYDPSLLGGDAETRAVVWQWLETRVLNKSTINELAKKLECNIERSTYVAGNVLTVIDILLYYALHDFMSKITPQQMTTTYMNLSRWFSHVQSLNGITQSSNNVKIIKNKVY